MEQSIRAVALNYLARREHSIHELRLKLLAKSFEQDEIELVLDKLSEENLLNEFRFAECYCRARITKGFGPVAIQHELGLKKVGEEIILEVLAEFEQKWHEVIKRVFKKKCSSIVSVDTKQKAKCWRFLMHRGFSPEQIKSVISSK